MSTSTKTELLHEASRMLLKKGLKGFSLQELASSLNIRKASLFHHFPSKLSLAVELYRFYQTSFKDWASSHQHLPAERQITSYADELTRWICEKQRVCPVGALSLEWHMVDPELQQEIRTLHTIQRDWLQKLYRDIHRNQGLKVSVSDAVIGTMGLIQGSIQLARLNDDPGLVKRNLRSYLKVIKE